LPISLVESALPDRSACPYDSRRDFFESTAPNQRGHTICRYLLFTRGSILMIRMQTPDGWITVAGPRNARTGAASCLQSLTPPRKVLDLPGPVIGNLLLKRAGGASKKIVFALKSAARSRLLRISNVRSATCFALICARETVRRIEQG
jgi:hypothetical protein